MLFEHVKKRKIDEICKATVKEVAGLDSVDDLIKEVSAKLEEKRSKNEEKRARINIMQLTIKRIQQSDDTAIG